MADSAGSAGTAGTAAAGEDVRRLADDYFRTQCAARPFFASVFGIAGYDAEVPDLSRAADEELRTRYAGLAAEVAAVEPAGLAETDRVSHAMLTRTLADQQANLRHRLNEVAVSGTMMGALSGIVALLPAMNVAEPAGADAYLTRLGKLGGYFDQLAERHRQAAAEDRFPTAHGVAQAVAQLDGYLATPPEENPLLRPQPGPAVDSGQWRARAGELVDTVIRPALVRYRTVLADDLLAVGRPDDRVGVCHLPGGPEGYLAQVRTHTTTDLSPAEIHEIGLGLVAELRDEFAERGGRALGVSDTTEVLRRLRGDTALRFETSAEIVATVVDALGRAQQALPDWFRSYDIAACEVREMDPVEAKNSVLGYYRPPAADGSRPGNHVVNTYRPELRPRYEYQTLAFHESVPGHHLQFALGQRLTDLPDFRRFGYVTAFGEGWALYTERLCDEMGLYSDELARLGMVSFDAWRAGRLVVDTGMHYHGWSREQAIAYLRDNTALSETNIANEVDRYIASPGQALAYMIGRLRIRELRDAVGDTLDIREFHHRVLGHGSVPLDVLEELVTAP